MEQAHKKYPNGLSPCTGDVVDYAPSPESKMITTDVTDWYGDGRIELAGGDVVWPGAVRFIRRRFLDSDMHRSWDMAFCVFGLLKREIGECPGMVYLDVRTAGVVKLVVESEVKATKVVLSWDRNTFRLECPWLDMAGSGAVVCDSATSIVRDFRECVEALFSDS